MLTGIFRASALIILTLLTLCILGGNGARVLFAERDARGSEDKSPVQITVRVEGENTGNFTVVVTPLTVAQYQAQGDVYGKICDSVLKQFEKIDTAEEEDFSTHPIEMAILDHATYSGQYEFMVDITLNDDIVQEAAEYFLLVLSVQDSFSKEEIEIDQSRQCSGVKIKEDEDDFGVAFESIVTEVSEDVGEVELFKIVKQGQTEQLVEVTLWPDPSYAYTVSATKITLQPNETSAIVNVTVLDDWYPEDNANFTIRGYTGQAYGQYQNSPISVTFAIFDNDYAMVGFETTEVTVIEGEVVHLNTVFRNNLTASDFRRYESLFTVYTELGRGNATAPEHYSSVLMQAYLPGDPIEISTVDDDKLENSRQFEVILKDPSLNPLNVLNPNRVIVTIRDNDGTPNQPKLGAITFNKGSITLSWTIGRDDLRPIEGYNITIETIQVKNRVSRSTSTRVNRQIGGDMRIETRRITVTEVNCKPNQSGVDYTCEHIVEQEVKLGTAYNVILCAGNEFANVCEESGFTIPPIETPTTRGPLGLEGDTTNSSNGLPMTTILWIVIGVLVALLICCFGLLCASFCSAIVIFQRRKKEIESDEEEDSKRTERAVRSTSSDSNSSTEAI